jgi:lysophospholipase
MACHARQIWNIDSNLVVPADGKFDFYTSLISEVREKGDQGFRTQITDYWGLALSDHLFPEPYHSTNTPNLTITDIRSAPAIQNASLPYPVIVALEREPGEIVIALNSTVWEFTLAEFGSWWWGSETKTQGGFTNVEYLGTAMENGNPVAEGDCVKGFSNLGFVAGTSSTLFNQAFVMLNESNSDSLITNAIESVLGEIGQAYNDVAVYPNSFYAWQTDNNPIANLRNITLVDGGEANENVPLEPFLVSRRGVDAIIAMDNSGDTTYSWPNGSSLWTSYQKGLQQAERYQIDNTMPVVPSPLGFVNDGLNERPVFFGCNETDKPLIVYLPNYPWNVYSNASTFQLEYPVDNAAAIVVNGRRTLELNATVSDWPTCLTCALMDRAATEGGAARSSVCQSCFDTWCWNGQDNTTERTQEYEPVLGQLPSFIQNLTGMTGTEEQPFQSRNAAGFRSGSVSAVGVAMSGLAAVALGYLVI